MYWALCWPGTDFSDFVYWALYWLGTDFADFVYWALYWPGIDFSDVGVLGSVLQDMILCTRICTTRTDSVYWAFILDILILCTGPSTGHTDFVSAGGLRNNSFPPGTLLLEILTFSIWTY